VIAVGSKSIRFIRARYFRDSRANRVASHHWLRGGWGTRFIGLGMTASEPESAFSREAGLTLVELIITVAIIGILATIALPIARFQVRREKERELRRDLWEMRAAIDKYKDAADKGAFQIKADSLGYPPDLQSLVDGVDVQGKKVRFLRRIPVDPMTGSADWGMRSNQDDPDSDSFGGQNVFDVYTKSTATALDGTKYSTW
jgi:general secretion pathway protein G